MPVVPGSVDVALADRGGGDLGSVGRCWEIEAAEQIEAGELVSPANPVSVKGRLKRCIQFWKEEVAPHTQLYN